MLTDHWIQQQLDHLQTEKGGLWEWWEYQILPNYFSKLCSALNACFAEAKSTGGRPDPDGILRRCLADWCEDVPKNLDRLTHETDPITEAWQEFWIVFFNQTAIKLLDSAPEGVLPANLVSELMTTAQSMFNESKYFGEIPLPCSLEALPLAFYTDICHRMLAPEPIKPIKSRSAFPLRIPQRAHGGNMTCFEVMPTGNQNRDLFPDPSLILLCAMDAEFLHVFKAAQEFFESEGYAYKECRIRTIILPWEYVEKHFAQSTASTLETVASHMSGAPPVTTFTGSSCGGALMDALLRCFDAQFRDNTHQICTSLAITPSRTAAPDGATYGVGELKEKIEIFASATNAKNRKTGTPRERWPLFQVADRQEPLEATNPNFSLENFAEENGIGLRRVKTILEVDRSGGPTDVFTEDMRPESPSFRGRETLVETVRRTLGEKQEDAASVLWMRGPAGSGKSTLWRVAAKQINEFRFDNPFVIGLTLDFLEDADLREDPSAWPLKLYRRFAERFAARPTPEIPPDILPSQEQELIKVPRKDMVLNDLFLRLTATPFQYIIVLENFEVMIPSLRKELERKGDRDADTPLLALIANANHANLPVHLVVLCNTPDCPLSGTSEEPTPPEFAHKILDVVPLALQDAAKVLFDLCSQEGEPPQDADAWERLAMRVDCYPYALHRIAARLNANASDTVASLLTDKRVDYRVTKPTLQQKKWLIRWHFDELTSDERYIALLLAAFEQGQSQKTLTKALKSLDKKRDAHAGLRGLIQARFVSYYPPGEEEEGHYVLKSPHQEIIADILRQQIDPTIRKRCFGIAERQYFRQLKVEEDSVYAQFMKMETTAYQRSAHQWLRCLGQSNVSLRGQQARLTYLFFSGYIWFGEVTQFDGCKVFLDAWETTEAHRNDPSFLRLLRDFYAGYPNGGFNLFPRGTEAEWRSVYEWMEQLDTALQCTGSVHQKDRYVLAVNSITLDYRALALAGLGQDAGPLFLQSCELMQYVPDWSWCLAYIHIERVEFHYKRGEYEQALEALRQAIDTRDTDDLEVEGRILLMLGLIHLRKATLEPAMRQQHIVEACHCLQYAAYQFYMSLVYPEDSITTLCDDYTVKVYEEMCEIFIAVLRDHLRQSGMDVLADVREICASLCRFWLPGYLIQKPHESNSLLDVADTIQGIERDLLTEQNFTVFYDRLFPSLPPFRNAQPIEEDDHLAKKDALAVQRFITPQKKIVGIPLHIQHYMKCDAEYRQKIETLYASVG